MVHARLYHDNHYDKDSDHDWNEACEAQLWELPWEGYNSYSDRKEHCPEYLANSRISTPRRQVRTQETKSEWREWFKEDHVWDDETQVCWYHANAGELLPFRPVSS